MDGETGWPMAVVGVPTALEMLADMAHVVPLAAQVRDCVAELDEHLTRAEAERDAYRNALADLVAELEQRDRGFWHSAAYLAARTLLAGETEAE